MRSGCRVACLWIACSTAVPVTASEAITLSALQWKRRVLLLPARVQGEARADWAANAAGLRERDLVVFRESDGGYDQVFPETRSTIRLRLPFRIEKRVAGKVTLIGKDGGIRREWERESRNLPAAVFARIDTMPMRQREMQEQR